MAYSSPPVQSSGDVIGATAWNRLGSNDKWMAESSTDGRPICKAYRTSTFSVSTNVNTALPINFNQLDNAGCHSTAVNPSRFTAPVDGWYRMITYVSWPANITGCRQIEIIAGGGGLEARDARSAAVAPCPTSQNCEAWMDMTAGQYAEVVVFQTSGGALVVDTLSFVLFEWMATR